MGQYDNYNNIYNIQRAQKRLDKLTGKRKPNQQKIEEAKEILELQKLFEHCQIFESSNGRAPNEDVKFSDDHRLIWFYDTIIPYDSLCSYSIDEKRILKTYTKSKPKGVFTRALVGSMIAGDLGAIVGAASADVVTETKNQDVRNGFVITLYLKDGKSYSANIENNGFISNKYHPKWGELAEKLSAIINKQV